MKSLYSIWRLRQIHCNTKPLGKNQLLLSLSDAFTLPGLFALMNALALFMYPNSAVRLLIRLSYCLKFNSKQPNYFPQLRVFSSQPSRRPFYLYLTKTKGQHCLLSDINVFWSCGLLKAIYIFDLSKTWNGTNFSVATQYDVEVYFYEILKANNVFQCCLSSLKARWNNLFTHVFTELYCVFKILTLTLSRDSIQLLPKLNVIQ